VIVDGLLQDIRYGVRMLIKSPAVTAIAILSLALGIGANTTIYTLLDTLFFQPLPIHDSGRVMAVYTTDARNPGAGTGFAQTSLPNYEDYRDRNTVFEGMAAHQGVGLNLAADGRPEQINGQIVAGNYFPLLGVSPALGRLIGPADDRVEGAAPVIVLSDVFFRARFAGDAGVVGRSLKINGRPFTVIGVAPPGFRGLNLLNPIDAWVPLAMPPG
jgi:hypothetical protein